MILPLFWSSMGLTAARVQSNRLLTFTVMVSSDAEVRPARAAGVIDQDVNPAEGGQRLLNHSDHLCPVRHINRLNPAFLPQPLYPIRHIFGRAGIEIGNADVGSAMSQSEADGFADPLAAAGDNGHLAVQS